MLMSAPVQGYVAAELARSGYQNVHDWRADPRRLRSRRGVTGGSQRDRGCAQHPPVRECVAVGSPDARKGEAVKVFVSLREALLEHCRQFLTGYKLPSAIEIRDELPKTAVGKRLRRQLRDEARATG